MSSSPSRHPAATALRACLAWAAGLGLAAAIGPAGAGQVEVRFVDPDKFVDAGRSNSERERTMKALAEYLQKLGRELPDGQTLRVDVKDIDLAGELEPFFGGQHHKDVRVLRGRADWPHLQLHYTLQAAGQTLKAGDAQLADLSYLYSLRGRDRSNEELAYEKRMVRRWFDETFTAR